jgi:hypothetical protein
MEYINILLLKSSKWFKVIKNCTYIITYNYHHNVDKNFLHNVYYNLYISILILLYFLIHYTIHQQYQIEAYQYIFTKIIFTIYTVIMIH